MEWTNEVKNTDLILIEIGEGDSNLNSLSDERVLSHFLIIPKIHVFNSLRKYFICLSLTFNFFNYLIISLNAVRN